MGNCFVNITDVSIQIGMKKGQLWRDGHVKHRGKPPFEGSRVHLRTRCYCPFQRIKRKNLTASKSSSKAMGLVRNGKKSMHTQG